MIRYGSCGAERVMYALPPGLVRDASARVTGLSCPDCGGVLEVEAAGARQHLHFRCRVGHGYAVGELLAAKEQVLEARLWGAVMAMEELAALLRDLEAHAGRHCWPGLEEPCQTRAAALDANARMLRALVEGDRPVDIGFDQRGSAQPESGTLP